MGPARDREPVEVKPIVFYFPQYHEIPENNKFWSKGFTEWDNVGKVTHNRWGKETIRPSIGFYNPLDYSVRLEQARQMKEHGVYGIAYHHYWFSDHPVMDGVLQRILEDGEPSLPFMFNWANEPWTRRWDGGNNDVLLDQLYGGPEDWKKHFDWLLTFFRHPLYIKVQGKPMFSIYKGDSGMEAMLEDFQRRAKIAGFPGLHIVQVPWFRAPDLRPWADAILEFEPNYAKTFDFASFPGLTRKHNVQYRGTFVSWDNTPRHVSDGDASWSPMSHPDTFYDHLVDMFNAVDMDPNPEGLENFFFLNAWNEWGEGNSLEPSVQHRSAFLRALTRALNTYRKRSQSENRDVQKLLGVGLSSFATSTAPKTNDPEVCLLVRTHSGQSPIQSPFFNVERSLLSLLSLDNPNWVAYVFQTDDKPFPELSQIVSSLQDSRIRFVELEKGVLSAFTPEDAGFHATEVVLRRLLRQDSPCGRSTWVGFLNGDDEYLPHTFSSLDKDSDVMGLNFVSRWTLWQDSFVLNSQMVHAPIPWDSRCVRLEKPTELCKASKPQHGHTELGANLFKLEKFVQSGVGFSEFTRKCAGCQVPSLLKELVEVRGWSFRGSSDTLCHLLHNPNPVTCKARGGVWFDTPQIAEFGCRTIWEATLLHWDTARGLDVSYLDENPYCIRYGANGYGRTAGQ